MDVGTWNGRWIPGFGRRTVLASQNGRRHFKTIYIFVTHIILRSPVYNGTDSYMNDILRFIEVLIPTFSVEKWLFCRHGHTHTHAKPGALAILSKYNLPTVHHV